ncbi:MAG TPA: hypothetical protein DEB46_09280 [Myxococcales bacterium]|nr:hypothetical protein [Myxococcales bacterium]HBU48491.1 hypothetical protein [Myxococcales bacterium]
MKIAMLCVSASLLAACASAPVAEAETGTVHAVAKRVEPARADFRQFKGALIVGVGNRTQKSKTVGAIELSVVPQGVGAEAIVIKGSGQGESLESGQELELKLPVTWQWPTDSATYLTLLQSESVPLELKGWAEVGGKRVPVQGSIKAPLPVLPEVKVRHVEATREGDLSKADLTFEIEVKNDNPFAIKVKKVMGTIVLEEVPMVTDHLISGFEKVAAGSSHVINVPMEMDSETHKKKLKSLLRGGILAYKVTGIARIHHVDVPIDLTGEVTFPEF